MHDHQRKIPATTGGNGCGGQGLVADIAVQLGQHVRKWESVSQ